MKTNSDVSNENEEPVVKLTVYIPDSLDRLIRGHAGYNRISLSQIATEALTQWAEKNQIKATGGSKPASKELPLSA